MAEQLPRGRSIESLKKEAKRWLSLLRDGDPDARARYERSVSRPSDAPTLREVQHALAREHGFDGWSSLIASLEVPRDEHSSIAYFETAAKALYDAYYSGTPDAMERHYAFTWHRRAWSAMRTYVQLDLGKRAKSADEDVQITPEDAHYLVARENGFESWAALESFVTQNAQAAGLAVRPLQATRSDGQLISRSWSDVVHFLRHGLRAAFHAHGQMTDAAMRDLARATTITSLHLGGSKRLTDEGIRHMGASSELQSLDLSGTGVTDASLPVIAQLPNLETLNLSGTRVTDAGLAHLAECRRLRDVDLGWTRTGDGIFRALAGKQSVRRIVSGNFVTDDGIALVREIPVYRTWLGGEEVMGLTSYESGPNQLTIRGSFTDAGMMHLRGLDGLYGLNIDDSKLALTARCLEPLTTLPNLGWLACDAKDDWMPAIARMARLRFLGVQDTVAGDDGFEALSRSQSIAYIWGRRCHNLQRRGFTALAQMPKLHSLSVSCLNVDDVGVSALPSFPALRELVPMDIPDAGYRHIAKCAELTSLVLMYCRDTTDAATAHIVGMKKLNNYFNSYTMITDRTPELLSTMDSLETICFSACHVLTNEGVKKLARLPRLRELDVSGQKLTPVLKEAFSPRVKVKVASGL